MSCPVVRAIDELYSSYDYNTCISTQTYTPSGIIGGGSSSVDVSMETAKFYITVRKLQFARAELASGVLDQSTLGAALESTTKYFDRMFNDYYGKTSKQILAKILGQSSNGLYLAMTRTVDIIDIMEGLCCTTLSRDFPSGMSLPTIYFDPAAIENIDQPENICSEVNKLCEYANKLCIGGKETKIDLMPKFTHTLRDFTFVAGDYKQLLADDMEVAKYAYELEQYQCSAIKKINEIMSLCQAIIDLAADK